MRRLWLVGALLLLTGACERENRVTAPSEPVISPVPAEVRAAPERVSIGGTDLLLGAELWRDFMPISPPDGKPLAALVWVATRDSSRLTIPIEADSCWVIYGDSAWVSALTKEPVSEADSVAVRFRTSGGPKWGPGVTVDVVVRLIPTSGGGLLLKAAGRTISRTD